MDGSRTIPVFGSVSDLNDKISTAGMQNDIQVNSLFKAMIESGGHIVTNVDDIDQFSDDICFLIVSSDEEEERILKTLHVSKAPILLGTMLEDMGLDESDLDDDEDIDIDDALQVLDAEMESEKAEQASVRLQDTGYRIAEAAGRNEGQINPEILRIQGVLSRIIPSDASKGIVVAQVVEVDTDRFPPTMRHDPRSPVSAISEFFKLNIQDDAVAISSDGPCVLLHDPVVNLIVESFTPAVITVLSTGDSGSEVRSWYMHCDGADGMNPDVCREVIETLNESVEGIEIPDDISLKWAADIEHNPLHATDRVVPTDLAVIIARALREELSGGDDEDEDE